MQMKKLVPVGVLTLGLGVVVGGRMLSMHLPPYEMGVHDTVEAQTDHSRSEGPHIGNCPVFPRDNVWNTPIDSLSVSPKSDTYLAAIGLSAKMHPGFGQTLDNGIPYTEVTATTKPVQVEFEYRDDSDLGNYLIPADAPVEGGASAGGDRHVIVVDPRTCMLYELYAAYPVNGHLWKAGSGIKMDMTDNALRVEGKTSADAAGLPILPGLIRYQEILAGEVNHAIRFTAPRTQAAYIWPARHQSGRHDPDLPPMGIRLRLRSDFDISHFSKTNQILLTAMKHYGLILSDNGGAMFIIGVPDKRWSDEDLHRLNAVTTADFEVVDESAWQMLPDSGRVNPLALKH
jgi:hypothetical protein